MNLLARCSLAALRAYSRLAPTGRGAYHLTRLGRRFVPRSQWQGRFFTPDRIALDLDLGTYPDCCMAVGLYELDTARLIRRLLRPGMWFVDCGANLGYFSTLASRLVGPAGRVDAFEPDPINRQRLENHLRENALQNRVNIHPLAVADRNAEITLYHPTGGGCNHGQASLYHSLVPSSQPFTVSTARLDHCLQGNPDLVKIDIEGAELAALEGMRAILASPKPPAIILEFNHESCAAAGYRPGDLYRTLLTIQPRYRLFWIDWRLKPVAGPEELDAARRHGNLLARCVSY